MATAIAAMTAMMGTMTAAAIPPLEIPPDLVEATSLKIPSAEAVAAAAAVLVLTAPPSVTVVNMAEAG